MEIGDHFLLINKPPYFYGMHNEDNITTVSVEVIEERHDAEGQFSGNIGTGYIAKGSDGKLYGYNYPVISEGLSDGCWQLAELSDVEEMDLDKLVWSDVTLYQCPAKAVFTKDLPFIDFCETHQRHVYTRNGCRRCALGLKNRTIVMNLEQHNFKGWY